MTLSICTICQDEETTISWLLDCCVTAYAKLKNNLKEVIIVDGGSVDNTVKVIESYRDKLPLVLIQHPFDTWGEQRNRYIEYASGEFIFGPDADMTWTHNLADAFLAGQFNNTLFWNFHLYSCAQDRHHYSISNSNGATMRLWKNGPRFVTNFHERLEGQHECPALCQNVFLFENSLLLTEAQLLNRGTRLQPFQQQLQNAGIGPGDPDRYIRAQKEAAINLAKLPESIISLL